MKRQSIVGFALLAFGFAGAYVGAQGQKVVVIRAGQMFDGKSDRLVSNQLIVVQGDRISEVGPAGSVKVPAGAQEIDLGTATVLPGLIDGHNHMFKVSDHPGEHSTEYLTLLAAVNAKKDLESGFTTMRDLSSGGYADVDLRNAINAGIIPGPRLLITTRGMIGSVPGPNYFQPVNGPWEGRQAVREQLKRGADFIKIYASGINYTPDGTLTAYPTITLEEQRAIVDEAHRQGVKVACTARGLAARQSIEAGCDSIENVTVTDMETLRMAAEKGIFMGFILARNKVRAETQPRNRPLAELNKTTFRNALKAGVKIFFAVNATGGESQRPGPYHGKEAAEFALMVENGMTPLQAIRAATSVGAENIGWQDRVGSIEKGKYADLVGVSGNPAKDITELERVKFVMKGGQIVRDALRSRPPTTASN